jgi:hypothetical protein
MQSTTRGVRLALLAVLGLLGLLLGACDSRPAQEGRAPEQTAEERSADEQRATAQGTEDRTERVPVEPPGDSARAPRESLHPLLARGLPVARALRERPDDAAAVLAEHGMTLVELESVMYRIAASPELSAAYEAELR